MTDSILALTKSSPVPVGPGTRRKAKHFQPPATRFGFRSKKSTGTKAVPLKKQDSTDIATDAFNVMYDVLYGSPYGSGVDVDQIQDWSKVFRDPFTADYGSLDKQPTATTKPTLQFVDYEEGPLSVGGLPWPQPSPPYFSPDFVASLRANVGLPPQSLENTTVNKLMQFPISEPTEKGEGKSEHLPEYKTDYRTAGYLREFINPEGLKGRIQAVVDALTPELDKFDSIAFTGMSGALIGPPVALALGKEVIMVRKKGHGSHSSYKVEGNYGSKRYIMVDDGRSTGGTEEHVIMSIRDAMPRAEYVGFMSAIFAEDYSEDRKDRGTAIRPALSKSWRPDTF